MVLPRAGVEREHADLENPSSEQMPKGCWSAGECMGLTMLLFEAKLSYLVSVQKRGFLCEGKARGRPKSGAYTWYVSIFRRLSSAASGQKDRFRIDTNWRVDLTWMAGNTNRGEIIHGNAWLCGSLPISPLGAEKMVRYILYFRMLCIDYPLSSCDRLCMRRLWIS
jgi:hypothetical protein